MQNLTKEQLENEYISLKNQYDGYKKLNLSLNMARGKPGKDQLSLSDDMMNIDYLGNYKSGDGTELRNYGVLDGIPECKKLFADMLNVKPENIIIFGNASLTIMYDYISQCMIFGAGDQPWSKLEKVKFLCPVPGYDRHFSILQSFGIEMVNVPMDENGPDMNLIDELIKEESIKGVICVPMYSNPGGITFSNETVRRFAQLKPAAKDFRVIWDNAYCVHHLTEEHDNLANIFELAKEYNNEDLFIEVASTSKITYPGAGVAVLAASDNNITAIKKRMTVQTIGYDKINQYRHVAFLKDVYGINEHMKKHAAILKPKFDCVLSILEKNLGDVGFCNWTKPKGGYFISLDVMPGCAKRTVQLCKEAGVTLTGAGATYPYGIDPEDKNIRIAPTFPDTDELKLAVEILCLCAKLAAVEIMK